jgi:hypothetical protein
MPREREYDKATRAQIITMKLCGLSNRQIEEKFGSGKELGSRQIQRLWDKAIQRGFDPAKPILLDAHVADAPRSGRPPTLTDEKIAEIEAAIVSLEREGKEASSRVVGEKVGVSPSTVLRALKMQKKRKLNQKIKSPSTIDKAKSSSTSDPVQPVVSIIQPFSTEELDGLFPPEVDAQSETRGIEDNYSSSYWY